MKTGFGGEPHRNVTLVSLAILPKLPLIRMTLPLLYARRVDPAAVKEVEESKRLAARDAAKAVAKAAAMEVAKAAKAAAAAMEVAKAAKAGLTRGTGIG